jgi:hypothetical protein
MVNTKITKSIDLCDPECINFVYFDATLCALWLRKSYSTASIISSTDVQTSYLAVVITMFRYSIGP